MTDRHSAPPPGSSLSAGTRQRNSSVDALRGGAIVVVFLWHANPVMFDAAGRHDAIALLLEVLQFVWSYEIALIAVPSLLLLSLVLFTERFIERGWAYAKVRLGRLGLVSAAWIGLQYALAFGAASLHLGPPPIVTVSRIVAGGPELLGRSSVLYFLVALFVLTLGAALYNAIDRAGLRAIIGGAIAVGSLVYFVWAAVRGTVVPLTSLANFAVYVPIARVIATRSLPLRRPLLLTFAAFAATELAWRVMTIAGFAAFRPSDYARLACVAGAAAAVCFARSLRVDPPGPLTWLSKHSLGVFAVHNNVLGLAVLALGALAPHLQCVYLATPFMMALAAFLTLLLVFALERTRLRWLVG